MSSQEWDIISSNELFKSSRVYNYKDWINRIDYDYEKIEYIPSSNSKEWETMMRSSKPPKAFQYVKRDILYF
ncbi:MAG: hypothetical protein CMP11_00375 [Zetaproteobacteria bacterium]|jgi:hypothetical protein|nr:hypothetical protein [Pseudobdellovibrionaceae bacterium]